MMRAKASFTSRGKRYRAGDPVDAPADVLASLRRLGLVGDAPRRRRKAESDIEDSTEGVTNGLQEA